MKSSHDTIALCKREKFIASKLLIFAILFFKKKKKKMRINQAIRCQIYVDL